MKESERQILTTYHEFYVRLAATKTFFSEKRDFIQEFVKQL